MKIGLRTTEVKWEEEEKDRVCKGRKICTGKVWRREGFELGREKQRERKDEDG